MDFTLFQIELAMTQHREKRRAWIEKFTDFQNEHQAKADVDPNEMWELLFEARDLL